MLVTLAVCLVLLLVLSPTEALLPAKLFGMKGLIKGLKVTKLLGLKGLKKGKASKLLRLAGLKSNIQFILHLSRYPSIYVLFSNFDREEDVCVRVSKSKR